MSFMFLTLWRVRRTFTDAMGLSMDVSPTRNVPWSGSRRPQPSSARTGLREFDQASLSVLCSPPRGQGDSCVSFQRFDGWGAWGLGSVTCIRFRCSLSSPRNGPMGSLLEDGSLSGSAAVGAIRLADLRHRLCPFGTVVKSSLWIERLPAMGGPMRSVRMVALPWVPATPILF